MIFSFEIGMSKSYSYILSIERFQVNAIHLLPLEYVASCLSHPKSTLFLAKALRLIKCSTSSRTQNLLSNLREGLLAILGPFDDYS